MATETEYYNHIKKTAISLYNQKYKNHIELDEAISEAYLWGAKNWHREHFHTQTTEESNGYIYFSIKRHLDRVLSKEIEKKQNEIQIPGTQSIIEDKHNKIKLATNTTDITVNTVTLKDVDKFLKKYHETENTNEQKDKDIINSLTRQQKLYLEQIYSPTYNYTKKDIAHMSGTSEAAVNATLARAKKAIKLKLGAE